MRFKLIMLLMLLLSGLLKAQEDTVIPLRKPYYPDALSFQYAGNVGMVSTAVVWDLVGPAFQLEYGLGYTPKFDAGQAIVTSNVRFVYQSKSEFQVAGVKVSPLALGLGLSHSYGERFSRYGKESKYTRGYYWWSNQDRYGLFYRMHVEAARESRNLMSRAQLYYELSLWDIDLFNYFYRDNYKHLPFGELICMGLGVRFRID